MYLTVNFDDLKPLLSIDVAVMSQLVFVNAVTILLSGYIFYFMVQALGTKMTLVEWVGLTFAGLMANYLTPLKIGTVSKPIYLKWKYGFSYTNFIVFFSGYNLLQMLVIAILGILTGSYMLYLQDGLNNILYLSLVLLLFVLGLPVLAEYYLKHREKLPDKVQPFLTGWEKLRSSRNLFLKIIIFHNIQILLWTFSHILLYKCISIDVSFLDMLLLTVLLALSGIFNITPGNIGIAEWIFIFASRAYGIGINESIVAATIGRAINLAILFTVSPIFYWILFREFGKEKNGFRGAIAPKPQTAKTAKPAFFR